MEAIPIKPLEVPAVSTVSVPDDEVCNLPLNISTTVYQIKNTGHPSKENITVEEQTNCYKTAIWKQLLAILPVYTLQLCYGMSSGYPAITTPQLTMDYAQFPIYDDQESWIVSIDNLVTPGVCIVSGYLQHKFGPKLILNCLAIWRCIMIKFSTWAVNRTCSYIIKPSHGDDQHINLVDTLHGHQEVHQTFNNLPFYDYLLCLSNASDKHLLHLLSFLIVQQSFFVVTGSNLTRLPPSLSEELSSVSVSDQCVPTSTPSQSSCAGTVSMISLMSVPTTTLLNTPRVKTNLVDSGLSLVTSALSWKSLAPGYWSFDTKTVVLILITSITARSSL